MEPTKYRAPEGRRAPEAPDHWSAARMGDTGVEALPDRRERGNDAHLAESRTEGDYAADPQNAGRRGGRTQAVPHGTDHVATLRLMLNRVTETHEREALRAALAALTTLHPE